MFYLQLISAGLAAYLIGAFPTGVIASKLKKNSPDVRYHGSGHIGGTNIMRLMGPRVGAAVVVIDALKGFVAWGITYIIMLGSPWALPLAGTLAVIGHCWPVYTRFHGGMGLATAGGMIFLLSPLTVALVVPIWAALFLGLFRKRYSPRSVILAMPIAVALTLFLMPLAVNLQWLLVLITLVLVIRHLPEWQRVE